MEISFRFTMNHLPIETEGPIEIIGAKTVALQGGMGGTYVKSQKASDSRKAGCGTYHSGW